MLFPSILMTAATVGSGRDPDVAAYAAASGAAGSYLDAVSVFISAEKAAGLWALTDDYWSLWAPNATVALTSLKQRRLATATAAPIFTADRGYEFNGTTQFIDTGFIPSTHAMAMTTNSVHAEVYERTNVSDGNNISFGGGSGSSRSVAVAPRGTTAARGFANSAFGVFTLPAADSRGLTQMGRSGASATDTYGAKNGATMTRTTDPAGLGASLPAHSLYIGAFSSAGVLASARAAAVGFAAVGAALTSEQRLARYTNVQALATAAGAQV